MSANARMLRLLKHDLQKMGDHQDEYLVELLNEAEERVRAEGITLNLDAYTDAGLVREYARWLYNQRKSDDPEKTAMPRALRFALNNRHFAEVMGGGCDDAT